MKQSDLDSMSADELWIMHEKISAILSTKLDAEKNKLERRLAKLKGRNERVEKVRRPYPKVRPKYRTRPALSNLVWTRHATPVV